MEPNYLTAARDYLKLGVQEIPGAKTNPTIARWLLEAGAWWRDDETPWCGVPMEAVLRECGYAAPKAWYRARAWLDWGFAIPEPIVGAFAIYERGAWSGHINLIVGRDHVGRLMGLGGNQGNKINIAPFDPERVLGYRLPLEYVHSMFKQDLPLLYSDGVTSVNEA